MMNRLRLFVLLMPFLLIPSLLQAKHRILSPNLKTLQVVVNDNWTDPLPVMTLRSDDVLNVGFDELSHNFHRFIVHVEHCEPDWSPSEDIFESDWLEGFNDWALDDYDNSLNTTVLYTHYSFQLPNDQCRLKMSGNYRLHILDEDNNNNEVAVVEFRVVEQLMNLSMGMTTNTDIDFNNRSQQLSMSLDYGSLNVTQPEDQLNIIVMQNGREDNMRTDMKPSTTTPRGLTWDHCRQLIFDAGNEYHRFEVLNPTHITLGLERVAWDEDDRHYHVYPEMCEPQRNYMFYKDADGAFYVRNSDNFENDRTSDYVYVHYKLAPAKEYEKARLYVDGHWTTEAPETYTMSYDERDHSYNAVILQKMGYYNYQLLMEHENGQTEIVPEEGSFYQTENRYQALVYYKGIGDRTWRLVSFRELIFDL
ncbi:MAG: DUF5103 domain-containing protein [Prevotella sp.]|nr:DUF5103 domain-containing protein [Prevotella sp.]